MHKKTSERRRILHLDGNWNTHDEIKALAEKACPGCEVVTVESGGQALRLLEEESFDLVIVDPWAGEINGFKVCKYLSETRPDVPVFFYAQFETMNGRKFAEAAGSPAYFLATENDRLRTALAEVLTK